MWWGVALFAFLVVVCFAITWYLYSKRDVPGRYYVRIEQ